MSHEARVVSTTVKSTGFAVGIFSHSGFSVVQAVEVVEM